MPTIVAEERDFWGTRLKFTLRDVRGARSVSVRVTFEGVVMTKPRWVSRRDAEKFLAKCRPWLQREIAKWEARAVESLSDRVLYEGREAVIRRASVPPVRFSSGEFWAPGESAEARLEAVLEWMKRRAKPTIREAVSRLSADMGVQPSKVSIRDQVSRWGSCSNSGSLSFNWRLVMAPKDVLEYIVIHELAHLIEHNHSPRFWKIVEDQCPDYKSCETWLDAQNDRILMAGRASWLAS